MSTANVVMDRALTLARQGTDREVAVTDLLGCCASNRVAVVMARQRVLEDPLPRPDEATQAVDLLDEVLRRLSDA
jgi:hypothetical protein